MERRGERTVAGHGTAGGYTLVELVMTISIVSVIALVPATVMLESIKVYARSSSTLDAAYQARLASECIKRDLRSLDDPSKIGAVSPALLTIVTPSGETISYVLLDGALTRNGDLLARGVSAMSITLRTQSGQVSVASIDVALVEVDLTVQTGDFPYRVLTSVCPGFARYVAALASPDAQQCPANAGGNPNRERELA